ncbi:hypothetical protein [Burkholderia sp. BCC0097]|uniref:hypothetical protein n=1 Tax=Burkholderia sp. BCC0097 TaxID=2676289 RepID=UPI00158F58F8|nr:hypothetical protein [Burkholderia sp. BCC0097]
MNEIKPTDTQVAAFVQAYFGADSDGQVGRHIAGLTAALNIDPLASRVTELLLLLEMIAADADARNGRLTSGVRAILDDTLIKAGRKAAPEPVRHFRACGEGL